MNIIFKNKYLIFKIAFLISSIYFLIHNKGNVFNMVIVFINNVLTKIKDIGVSDLLFYIILISLVINILKIILAKVMKYNLKTKK